MMNALLSLLTVILANPADYSREIKPLFAKHCVGCHGPKKSEGGLRLDSSAGITKGGDSGAAIEPGKPAESRLFKAIAGTDKDVTAMPPEGPSLPADAIALVRSWIAAGAKMPEETASAAAGADHWAFRRAIRPALPAVKNSDWTCNPIDHFILLRLEQKQITPSPEAERETLIRRLSLDLLGVPPSIADVEAFVNDREPEAYERLVERLLSSPHYGERWGRHWLDLARYADSNGYTRDFGRQIWKYRDWVVAAINRDLPFDQFTIEQLAGDMLPNASLDQKIATGFHRNTLFNEEGGTDQEQFRIDAVADRLETTGSVFLGLTLGCARCHQHKYDPISQREYYQLFAFLNNCDEPQIEAPSPFQVADGWLERRADIRRQIAAKEAEIAKQQDELTAKQLEWERAVTPPERARLPGPTQVAFDLPIEKRDDAQKKLVTDHFRSLEVARKTFPLLEEIAKLKAIEPVIPTTLVLKERAESRETHVHLRGNFLDHGVKVSPTIPTVFAGKSSSTSGRLDFARWLVDGANPLTPRVIVNRYWQAFFGRGLVETENDFGTQGTPPTHPDLLDWLADEFVASGWQVKQMHRLLVTSATYRQSSRLRPELADVDARNRLLARQSRLRIEAEAVRDSALATSGLWSREIGGPSVFPPQPDGVFDFTQDPKPWKTETGANRFRRGMYTHLWRSSPYPALTVFDFPEANVTCTRRIRSNTPLQSLTLANDTVFVECAQAMARRVLAESPGGTPDRVVHAFRLALARSPSLLERERISQLVQQQIAAFEADSQAAADVIGGDTRTNTAERAAWTMICRVLLNLDEFVTRE